MRGWEGGAETWLIGFGTGVVLTVVTGCAVGIADLGGNTPKDGANQDCEEAWVVANDGNEETVNETAILEQPWCIDHLAAQEREDVQP